jgi:hypothetical protein
MTGLIIKERMLLKWSSTHDVNSVTGLETLRSANPQPLFLRQSYCTSQGRSSCLTELNVIEVALILDLLKVAFTIAKVMQRQIVGWMCE